MTKVSSKSYSPPQAIEERGDTFVMQMDDTGVSSAYENNGVNKRKYVAAAIDPRMRMSYEDDRHKPQKNSKWFNRALFTLLGLWLIFLGYIVFTAVYSPAKDDINVAVPKEVISQVLHPVIPAPEVVQQIVKADQKQLLQAKVEKVPEIVAPKIDEVEKVEEPVPMDEDQPAEVQGMPIDEDEQSAGFPMNDYGLRKFGEKCERGIGRVPLYSNNPKYLRIEEYDYKEKGPFNMTHFYKTYILGQKPVIIKNSINHWRATEHWKSDDYLEKAAGDEQVIVEQSLNNKFGFVEKTWSRKLRMSMKEFLKLYKEKDPDGFQYYQSTKVWPKLRKDYIIQDYAPCLNQSKLPYYHHFGIWFGYGGQNSLIHNDPEDNFLNILDGYKRLIMYPPSQGDNLYEDRRAEARTSEINIADPDYEKFPLFKDVTPYEVIVGPGDVLFIPAYWFHQVESSCRHLAFNLFFDIHNNMGILDRERAKMKNPDVDLDPKSVDLVKMLMEMPSQCELANELKAEIQGKKK